MELKLSILDQSPINDGETATEAFHHTIELAKKAEELGYHRFWVSEHHDSNQVVGSSPEVLISHLLAKTERIRIGSGGVMLQHYSPYKVAENFNVLASLAPGRVDLGIGRAPGGLPRSTKALQQEAGNRTTPLSEKLVELEQFIHDNLDENHPLYGLQAYPIPPHPANIYLLGTSTSSAKLAANLGYPYVFAHFINNDDSITYDAFETYRKHFNHQKALQAQTILALSVIVADTDEEAKLLASDSKIVKIHMENGKTLTVNSIEKAKEYGQQSKEKYTIEVKEATIIFGSKETVRKKLLEVYNLYKVNELIVTAPIKDFRQRIHSYELLKEVSLELAVK
ncbi:luciferase family oxidoreductase group 1 [Bacillus fengqiuensis]|nr:luciferase family oxidoreductase group 1 [Bacillus fengqiuensis]